MISNHRFLKSDTALIAAICVANVCFHLLLPRYGYHGDELYYTAIADGFRFSNLDMPPVSPLFLKVFLVLFGHSLSVVHLASSTAGSIVIALSCLIAREMGGKRYAILLTGLFTLFSSLVIFGSLYTYDCVSYILWSATFYLLARMINGASQRLWLLVGLIMGIGFLTKLTILFLGTSIFIALWFVPQRRWFAQPWIWLGGVIALLCSIPVALWQHHYGWYFLEYATSYAGRTTHESPVFDYLWSQILPNNLFAFPVWLTGLVVLLFHNQWKPYRLFGLFYVVVLLLMFFLGGQFYFMVPVYGLLLAAGSVVLERWIERRAKETHRKLWRRTIPVGFVLFTLPFLPLLVPALPVNLLIPYMKSIGIIGRNIKTEDNVLDNLPQHFAQRFGWDEMGEAIAGAYHSVEHTSDDPVQILTGNYAQAALVHLVRDQYGLPEPISSHGWFYFEAMRRNEFAPRCVTIGIPRSTLMALFRTVEGRGMFTHPLALPRDRNDSIYYCSGPKVDRSAYWKVLWRWDRDFDAAFNAGGIDSAARYFTARRRQDSTVVLFTERQMNNLGYYLLDKGRLAEAITAFRLNTEAYPDWFNSYDSLGDALMRNADYDGAARNYEKSLELYPGNEHGRKQMAELRSRMPLLAPHSQYLHRNLSGTS
jgi:MFS family permease